MSLSIDNGKGNVPIAETLRSNPSLAIHAKGGDVAEGHPHDRIDWSVAKRILKVLYLEGSALRTNLAMKVGVNYNGCIRYISWMLEIGWIEAKGKQSSISLTDRGIEVFERLKC